MTGRFLDFAKESGRIIITRDSDFLRIRHQGLNHRGIIFIPSPLTIGEIIKEIEKISIIFEPADLENRIIFIPIR